MAATINGGFIADFIVAGTMLCDRLKGGTLTAGGASNGNGVIRIMDASGAEIGRWDCNGITATKGTFSGDLKAAGGTFKGKLEAADGTFNGDFSVTGFSEDKYPIKLKNAANAYFGLGGTGFLLAKGGHYIKLDYDISAGMPRLYAGSYTSIDESTFALSGVDNHAYLDADGMFKSEWARANKTEDEANVHISSTGYFLRVSSSSRRYKKDENTDLQGMHLERLYDLPVKTFKYKDGYLYEKDRSVGKDILGFIAEDMEEYFPQAVSYEDGVPETWKTRIMIPAMMKLIQDLNKRVKRLEKKK